VDYGTLSWLGRDDPAAWDPDGRSQSLELQQRVASDWEPAGKPFQAEGERVDDTREAMLRPEFSDGYPRLRPDWWYPARQLAETVPEQ
jgi:hypothetical protein